MRTVPRELFLPGVPLEAVYRDAAVVTKVENGVSVSSSSQPAIMALMLRQLDVRPGQRVLEIGAGTGYNAALLRELVGPAGAVDTVDIDPEVAGWAAHGSPRRATLMCGRTAQMAPRVGPKARRTTASS